MQDKFNERWPPYNRLWWESSKASLQQQLDSTLAQWNATGNVSATDFQYAKNKASKLTKYIQVVGCFPQGLPMPILELKI